MAEAMRVLFAAAGVLLATLAMAENPPLPALHAITTSETQAVREALVDSGVNYQLDAISSRLARQNDGSLIGYDFWDMDELPFDAEAFGKGNTRARA